MHRLKSKLFTLSFLLMIISAGACTRSGQPAAGDPPPAASAAQPEVVGNATCPVSDKSVAGSAGAPTFYSDFRGMRVGFMCPNCKATFDTSPAEKKQALTNKALGSVGRPPLD